MTRQTLHKQHVLCPNWRTAMHQTDYQSIGSLPSWLNYDGDDISTKLNKKSKLKGQQRVHNITCLCLHTRFQLPLYTPDISVTDVNGIGNFSQKFNKSVYSELSNDETCTQFELRILTCWPQGHTACKIIRNTKIEKNAQRYYQKKSTTDTAHQNYL